MRRVLASVVLVGCSSFTAAPATPDADAGTVPVADAGPVDPAARYCAAATAPLCADWEGPATGAWQTGEKDIQNEGTLQILGASAFEGALGLHTLVPKGGSTFDFAEVSQEYQTSTTTDAFVEAQVRVRQPTGWSTGELTVLSIEYTNAIASTVEAKIAPSKDDPTHASLFMYARGKDVATNVRSASLSVPYGTWLRVRVEARVVTAPDAGTDGGSGIVTVTGLGTLSGQLPRGALDGSTQQTKTVVGVLRFANATDADIDVDYDDVLGGPL